MKAMNEFQTVLVIATLILAACATMDMPPSAPEAEVARAGQTMLNPAMAWRNQFACCVRQRTEPLRHSTEDGGNDRPVAEHTAAVE
jgi:outer membrane biogenesis lipoprotein LolB